MITTPVNQEWRFVPLSAEFATLTDVYQGLGANYEDILQSQFSIEEENGFSSYKVNFFIELVIYDFSNNVTCNTNQDCAYFAEFANSSTSGFPYIPSTCGCYQNPLSVSSGSPSEARLCGMQVKLGTNESCFSGKENAFNSLCLFLVTYTIFANLPQVFTFLGLWQWGNMAFFASFFFWTFLALAHAKVLLNKYRRFYYFTSNNLALFRGTTYKYRLEFVGMAFSKWEGNFVLSHPTEGYIHEHRFSLEFPEMEQEDNGTSSQEIRGFFIPTQNYVQVEFFISWDNFQSGATPVPFTTVKFNQRIPARVSTYWNLFFVIPFFLYHLISGNPKRKEFKQYSKYLVLVLYIASVHFCWIIVIIFSCLLFGNNTISKYWSSTQIHPAFTLVSYVLFSVFIAVCIIMSIQGRRFMQKIRVFRQADFVLEGSFARTVVADDFYQKMFNKYAILKKKFKPLLVPSTGLHNVYDKSELGDQDCSMLEVIPMQVKFPSRNLLEEDLNSSQLESNHSSLFDQDDCFLLAQTESPNAVLEFTDHALLDNEHEISYTRRHWINVKRIVRKYGNVYEWLKDLD